MFEKYQNSFLNNRFIFEKPGEKPDQQAISEAAKPVDDHKKETLEVKSEGQTVRLDLADQNAQTVASKPEGATENDKETPPGKIHQKYADKIQAIAEETAEKDRATLKDSEIKTIRFNTRLLKPKAEKEDEATQASSIKEETEKRIKAYTDKADKDWNTLNYQRLGSDKKGHSHELNIGLGDILLDPDIKEILVKKGNGEMIKAHRGVVETRQSDAGRQAFLDENGQYVKTYTGDSFRILSNEETDLKDPKALKKYLEEFSTEEKAREENEKHFDDEIKAKEDQESYYREADFDPNKSVVEQIRIPLNAAQKENAAIIERVFKEGLHGKKDLTDEQIARIIAAAIVNAYKESTLNAKNETGDNGHSIGLFQVNDVVGAGKYLLKTMSRQESIEYRQNPENNCNIIINREILDGPFGPPLLAAAKNGASITKLAALFSRYIERPADVYGAMQARSKEALRMFGERVVNNENEISEPIDNGKEGPNGKGIIKLSSGPDKKGQDSWIFGSSGAVAMNNLKNKLALGNTGFFGIVGINPMNFKEKLEAEWPRISKLKMPKQIILVGMATNSLGTKDNPELIEKNLKAYEAIKEFLESKGTKVKFATVQPAEGMGDQVSKFNEALRKKYGADSDTLIDIAKYTTTADGKHLNKEYAASDGIHLSRKGYEKLADLIKEGANG